MTALITRPELAPEATKPPPGRKLVDQRPLARKLGPGPRVRFAGVLGPVLLLGLWFLMSWTGALDPRILSEPWVVWETGKELIADGRLQENLAVSSQRAAYGLVLGTAVGLVLALISGLSRIGEAVIDGPVQIKRAIPSLALIPLLVLWFGVGENMKIYTIALGAFVPIYIHTHSALRRIDLRFVELAQTVNLSRVDFLRKVIFPGALPGFLLGLRFAVTGVWISLVVVEQINATSGIGYMMELARTYGQTEIIVVGLVVYGVLGLVSDGVVRLIERRALRWQRTLG